MNDPPLLLNVEMCFGLQIVALTSILVLFVHANSILAIRTQANIKNPDTSTKNGVVAPVNDHQNSVPHIKTQPRIDAHQEKYSTKVRAGQKKHLLKNEFAVVESPFGFVQHVQEIKERVEEIEKDNTDKSIVVDDYDRTVKDNKSVVRKLTRSIFQSKTKKRLNYSVNDFHLTKKTRKNTLIEQDAKLRLHVKAKYDERGSNKTKPLLSRDFRLKKRSLFTELVLPESQDNENRNQILFNDVIFTSNFSNSEDFESNNSTSGSKTFNLEDESLRHRRQTTSSTTLAVNNRNIRAREEGDAIIGALFPLHHAPTQKTAYTRQCGEIREYYGIQRVETFIMTIEKINSDHTILPNIKLGWDIRDSCWYSAIALENSIDFIKDAIASQSRTSAMDASTTISSGQNTPLSPPSLLSSSREKATNKACGDNKNLKPIIALVGPGSSEASIQVQNLLQIFNIPQIGYSATTMDLSDKSHYKYFLRVVPPDKYQAQALVDLLVMFNWTYISTVHSDGNYGVRGTEKFADLAKAKGICIAASDNIASTAEDSAFDAVLDNLLDAPNASVVVCFCEGNTVKNIFLAIRRRQVEGRFLIIGSDGWGNRLDVVEGLETAAAGGISIKLHSPPLNDFDAYYDKLKPNGSPKNPWLHEFWEWRFKCSLDKNDLKGYTRICTGNESLAGTEQDSKLGFVVNAVTTMARALHNMHQDVCPGSSGLCRAMEPLNGSVYLQYLLNVSFKSYSEESVHFDSQGDPPGRYEILNYQPISKGDSGNVTYNYVTIGHWMTGTLTLTGSPIYWPRMHHSGKEDTVKVIKSVCSEPCKIGQAKKVRGVACCWICTTCLENEILVDNNTDCRPCDRGEWPNNNKTDCEEIPIDFIDWSDTQAILCISVGCLGICFTCWVFAIFARYHDTPIVKASTRELSYIILVGICLAFGANFFIVAKPTKPFCYLTRILPGLSFSLIYGALVTRTNRIARILEGSKRIMTKKPRFMSATAQVVITGIIIGIECAIIAGMLVYQPADSALDYPAPKKVQMVCDTSTQGIIVPLTFDLLLIIFCTLYAVKTRNLPENFNEAKFIGFTMYSTCVIWLGFFPIYFAGDNKEITLSLSVSLSAAIALVLLFLPKVYVIVWVPEKNTRGAFTTSKDVRCHIGSKSMASGDSVDAKEGNTFENLYKSEKGQSKYWRQKSLDEKRLRFVMKRAGGQDGETPYINHGVLPNISSLRNAFADRDSKESSKTDTTPVSSLSYPDKERQLPVESREATSAEMIRQNLAKDYPFHKRQSTLRPGSPAEREKHRVHSVDHHIDLDMLLGLKTLNGQQKLGKTGDFRKSLSSTCVSSYRKTRNIHCQTGEELVMNLLPPLRKRCVSKNKNKLERSGAVDDGIVSLSFIKSKNINMFNNLDQRHSNSLLASNHSPESSPEHYPNSLSLPSPASPVVVCHIYNPKDYSSLSELDSRELLKHHNELIQRRHSHNVPSSEHYNNPSREGSNDLSSVVLSLSDMRSLTTFQPEELTPDDSPDYSFMEGIHNLENAISPVCKNPYSPAPRASLIDHPDSFLPVNSHCVNSSPSFHQEASTCSPRHQESLCSSPISTSSSSFTLPPFPSSIDSCPSEETFDDSDNCLEMDESTESTANDACSDDKENNSSLTPQNSRHSQAKGDDQFESEISIGKTSVVPPGKVDYEADVIEFQKYLQGHGVAIDFSTVRSSDV